MTVNGTKPEATSTSATVDDPFKGASLSDLLNAATGDGTPRVRIPDAIKPWLADCVSKCAANTNRYQIPVTIGNDALAKGILAFRPADAKLTGDALYVAAAKELQRQVKQYAADIRMSTTPKRDGRTVTFRFSKPVTPKTEAPVTSSNTADAATS